MADPVDRTPIPRRDSAAAPREADVIPDLIVIWMLWAMTADGGPVPTDVFKSQEDCDKAIRFYKAIHVDIDRFKNQPNFPVPKPPFRCSPLAILRPQFPEGK